MLKQAGDLSGKVIVTCSLPMDAAMRNSLLLTPPRGRKNLQRRSQRLGVVSAFNTVASEVLFGVYEARRKATRPSLVYCGDDESGKTVAV